MHKLIKIEGAGDHNLEYNGFVEAGLTIPSSFFLSLHALFLVPDTVYNASIPVLIGINVLKVAAQEIENMDPDDCQSNNGDAWRLALQCLEQGV